MPYIISRRSDEQWWMGVRRGWSGDPAAALRFEYYSTAIFASITDCGLTADQCDVKVSDVTTNAGRGPAHASR